MAHVEVPESLPINSQLPDSQRHAEYAFEATQVSQPHFSQTQGTQGTAFVNSQVEPRRKYCEPAHLPPSSRIRLIISLNRGNSDTDQRLSFHPQNTLDEALSPSRPRSSFPFW